MKFSRYLQENIRPDWVGRYIDYRQLKKLLAEILETGHPVYAPTTLSFTLDNGLGQQSATPQERFFVQLEADVARVGAYTQAIANRLRSALKDLEGHLRSADLSDPAVHGMWLGKARGIGQQYVDLEKFVNLNYAGLQKILKKHDKLFPQAQCRPFYKVHISSESWARGDHHDVQVTLSRIFSRLHSATLMFQRTQHRDQDHASSQRVLPLESPMAAVWPAAPRHPTSMLQHKDRTTRTFWVRPEHMAEVKHLLLQHLLVVPPSADDVGVAAAYWQQCEGPGQDDVDVVHVLYLDNPSLELYHNLLFGRPYATTLQIRWHGRHTPEQVKLVRLVHREGWRPEHVCEEKIIMPEAKVAEFLAGRWTWGDARKFLMREGSMSSASRSSMRASPYMPAALMGPQEAAKLAEEYGLFKTFTEVQRLVEGRGLQPVVKARFTRTIMQPLPHPHALSPGGAAGRSLWDTSPQVAPPPTAGGTSPDASGPSFSTLSSHSFPSGHSPMTGQSRHQQGQQQGQGAMPFDAGPLPAPPTDAGFSVQLEEDVQMFLEYDLESAERLQHGMWHQANPADAIEFPYGVLKLNAADGLPLPDWLQLLVDSDKLLQVHDFSKFLHACAGLMPDLVRAVPAWVDDPAVQKSLYANVLANQDLALLQLAGHHVVEELEEGRLEESEEKLLGSCRHPQPDRRRCLERQATSAKDSNPVSRNKSWQENDSPMLPLLHALQRNVSKRLGFTVWDRNTDQTASTQTPLLLEGNDHEECNRELHGLRSASVTGMGGAGPGTGSVGQGWQAKLLQRQRSAGRAYLPRLMLIDPGQFMRNERIFLLWLRVGITVGGLATGLLGFAANARIDRTQTPTIFISEATAFVLMALAITMVGYGLVAFVWRSLRLQRITPTRYDDTAGMLVLTCIIVMALSGLFAANISDLVEVLSS